MENLPTAQQDHALIGKAAKIPVTTPIPVISVSPIVLRAPDRLVDLQLKITAPISGNSLPIVLLSHGHGQSNNLSSLNGYGPLANFWASHGFVVIQPTHLSSKTLSLDPSTPGGPIFWQSRVQDMKLILDQLEAIETVVPTLQDRLDKTRIAVAGHSLGSHTASVLLGAQLKDPEDGITVNMIEPRIKAGILLGAIGNGNGGKDLSGFATGPAFAVFRDPSFAEMTTPTLVVAGDKDVSPHLTTRGWDWHADPYTLSEGPKSLFTLFGGEHIFGGISGYDAVETTDESVEKVAVVQRMTWAYLKSQLYPQDDSWKNACAALEDIKTLGKVESK